MNFKPLMLGGAALIALSGVTLSSIPASAADPEERAVTRDLNSQQLDTPSIVTQPARPGEMSTRPTSLHSVELDDVDSPQAALINRMVQTRAGEPIGRVSDVVFDQDGNAIGVDVALTRDGRIVSIQADAVVFDEDNDVLVTDLSGADVRDLPRI